MGLAAVVGEDDGDIVLAAGGFGGVDEMAVLLLDGAFLLEDGDYLCRGDEVGEAPSTKESSS